MSFIKCDCGKRFLGQEDKEDTCPECLRNLINPKDKGHYDFENQEWIDEVKK